MLRDLTKYVDIEEYWSRLQSNFNGGLAPLAPWPPVRGETHLHRLLVLGAAAAGQAAGPLGAGGTGGEAL